MTKIYLLEFDDALDCCHLQLCGVFETREQAEKEIPEYMKDYGYSIREINMGEYLK